MKANNIEKEYSLLKQTILSATKQRGRAFILAPEELKNDKSFVLEAVSKNAYAFRFASKELRADKEVLYAALNNQRSYNVILRYASEELQNDIDTILYAIEKNPQNFRGLDKTLKHKLLSDRSFLLKAVSLNGNFYNQLPDDYKNDKSLIIPALKSLPAIYRYVSKDLESDLEILSLLPTPKQAINDFDCEIEDDDLN